MLYSDHSGENYEEDWQKDSSRQSPSNKGSRKRTSPRRRAFRKQCSFHRKTIAGMFAVELCLLAALFVLAGSQKKTEPQSFFFPQLLSVQFQESEASLLANRAEYFDGLAFPQATDRKGTFFLNFASPLFSNYLRHEQWISCYLEQSKAPGTNQTGSPAPLPTVPADTREYKIFRFLLGTDGFSVSEQKGDSIPAGSGIQEDLSGKRLAIENRSELKYGFLKIANNAFVPTFYLQDVLEAPLVIPSMQKDTPQILLYHTHTEESYCVTEADKNSNTSYSKDPTKNVVFAGRTLQNVLQQNYSLPVLHDTTTHNTYNASLRTVTGLLEANPTVRLTVDIHRNAIDGTPKYGPTVTKDGTKYAPIQFVVASTDSGGTHPNWKENFKLAMLVLSRLEERVPGISRGIATREDPYNQNITDNALLVEIGFNGNYLDEVRASSQLLAEVLGEIYSF